MAHRLGYDAELLGRVCRSCAQRLSQSVRRRLKREHRLDTVATLHPGIVTVIQRFRSDLGLYVHLHCLVTDGAFEESYDDEAPRFRRLFAPSDSDLVDVLRLLADDLGGSTGDDIDIDPGIAACVELALSTPATSTPPAVAAPALNVHAFGMNLHAATTVDGRDRKRLERLCRYLLRPPFASEPVHWLPDGRVRLDIARRDRVVHMRPRAVHRQAHRTRSSPRSSYGPVRWRVCQSPLPSPRHCIRSRRASVGTDPARIAGPRRSACSANMQRCPARPPDRGASPGLNSSPGSSPSMSWRARAAADV